jgi:hypothetical protein
MIIMLRNLNDFQRFGIEVDFFELAEVEYYMLTIRTNNQLYWIDIRRAKTTGHIKIQRPDSRNIRHALSYLSVILSLNELL